MRFLNNIGMKKKLLLSYMIIIIIPICIIGYFLTSALYSSSFSNVSNISEATFKQIDGNYINKLRVYSNIVDTIINDSTINKYINTYYDQAFDAYEDYNTRIAPLLNTASYNDKSVEIRIFSANNTIDVLGQTHQFDP